jgi:hypothetical protein
VGSNRAFVYAGGRRSTGNGREDRRCLSGLWTETWPALCEDLIKFAPKMFSDGPEVIEVSGTLTGDGIGYPNNTNVVTCWKDRKQCTVVAVEADKEYSRYRSGVLPNYVMD